MAKVVTDDKHYKDIADSIRYGWNLIYGFDYPAKYPPADMASACRQVMRDCKADGILEGKEQGKQEGIAIGKEQGKQEGIAIGIEQGKQVAYDAFWDVYQNNGEPMNYRYAFCYGRFSDAVFNPKYPITCNSDDSAAQYMFYNSPVTDTKVAIYAPATNITYCFRGSALETIRLLNVYESTTMADAFTGCTALVNITIGGTIGQNVSFAPCTKLSKASIASIVGALSADVSGKKLTLSKTAVDEAFETSKGANDGSTSAEWNALGGTNRPRQNWTIALS